MQKNSYGLESDNYKNQLKKINIMDEYKQKKQDLLKELWYKRNPCHDKDTDGVDRFWGTVICVFDDLNNALTKKD